MTRVLGTAVLALLCTTGCTTGYWAHRGRDALDTITIGCGLGGGAKVNIGPFRVGFLIDSPFAALRGGEFAATTPKYEPNRDIDFEFICFGAETFTEVALDRGKDFGLRHALGETYWDEDKSNNAYYFTQLEVCGGLLGTIRVGVNPGEMLDFFLGWFGVDIYDDDHDRRRERGIEREGPQPVPVDP